MGVSRSSSGANDSPEPTSRDRRPQVSRKEEIRAGLGPDQVIKGFLYLTANEVPWNESVQMKDAPWRSRSHSEGPADTMALSPCPSIASGPTATIGSCRRRRAVRMTF